MILKSELFPYQKEAVEKLSGIRIGALYFDMGTGKTRTALQLIHDRMQNGLMDKVLWLCPCSVKENLIRDLNKHSEDWQNAIRIEGIESLSSSSKLYNSLLIDYGIDRKTMVIVDESNLIKNNFAKRTQRIYELGSRAGFRMILNGTPVTKNEADLYSQWFFLDKRIFGYRTFHSFAANHLEYDENHRVRRVLNTDYLAEKMAPYSVVRKKEDVLKLPKKGRYKVSFEPTRSQYQHYRRTVDEFVDKLSDCLYEESESAIYRTFTALQLVSSGRKVTDHWIDESWHLTSEPFFAEPAENPRIQCLQSILARYKDTKVIIWVKFKHETEDISKILEPGSYAIFTGDLSLKKRNAELSRFMDDEKCQYLIANKVCGGYGLNLQICHVSVFYDNDFNYGTRAQAEDRIYRLGQEHDVEIVDIVSNLAIDQMIDNNLNKKENLMKTIKDKIKNKSKLKGELLGDKNRIGRDTKKEPDFKMVKRASGD